MATSGRLFFTVLQGCPRSLLLLVLEYHPHLEGLCLPERRLKVTLPKTGMEAHVCNPALEWQEGTVSSRPAQATEETLAQQGKVEKRKAALFSMPLSHFTSQEKLLSYCLEDHGEARL